MSSIPILIREVKEPVDSRWLRLKFLTKEKERKEKARKARKPKGEKKLAQKKVRQEKSGKSSPRDIVPGHMGTQYHQNTSQKIFQVKAGTFS